MNGWKPTPSTSVPVQKQWIIFDILLPHHKEDPQDSAYHVKSLTNIQIVINL